MAWQCKCVIHIELSDVAVLVSIVETFGEAECKINQFEHVSNFTSVIHRQVHCCTEIETVGLSPCMN